MAHAAAGWCAALIKICSRSGVCNKLDILRTVLLLSAGVLPKLGGCNIGMQQGVGWGGLVMTYGVIDELRYNGLHEILVAAVADQSNQHLKQLTYQALKVHIVSVLVCLHTELHSPLHGAAHSFMHCRSLHCTWQSAATCTYD